MKEVKKTRKTVSHEAAKAAHGVRHRKRRKRSYALYYLLLLIFVLISGITLSVTVFFNIDTITVNGTQQYSAEDIITKSGIRKGNNLFRINPEKSEKALTESLKNIDDAKVSRRFPNGLLIEITDAVPTYYVENHQGYMEISAGGRILNHAGNERSAQTKIVGVRFDQYQPGEFIDTEKEPKLVLLQKILSAFKDAGITELTQIDLSNEMDISVQYQQRVTIKIGSISELSYKIKFTKKILDTELGKEEKGVIDATTPGKVLLTPGSMELSSSAAESGTDSSELVDSSNSSHGNSSISSAETTR